MLFFLRFRDQLRRTRTDTVPRLEETLRQAIVEAGGKLVLERSVLQAVFDEEPLGFWLDMFILIENLKKSMDESADFFGFALVICRKLPGFAGPLCRFLSSGGGGFFLDSEVAKVFSQYAVIEKPAEWLTERGRPKYGSDAFYKIKELKVFTSAVKDDFELQMSVFRSLKQESGRNVLITCRDFSRVNGVLYQYCEKLNEDFPSMTVCFGKPGALTDAWSVRIRSLLDEREANKAAEETDELWQLLFRERLRDEVSAFSVRTAKRFFYLLLGLYTDAAVKRNCIPVVRLENVHLAEKAETELLVEILSSASYRSQNGLLILGTCVDGVAAEKLHLWERVFPKVIKMSCKKQPPFDFSKFPAEFWEIVYAITLFGRYFPPGLFQKLFEEEGKNPITVSRVFSFLQTLGVIDDPREPVLPGGYFTEYARGIPEERIGRVKAVLCRRLLDWTQRRNIHPCFRLLTILAEHGGAGKIDDVLILKSVFSDVTNKTTSGIELAIKNGQLENIAGSERAAAVRYIFETARALLMGGEQEIHQAFEAPPPDCGSFPVMKTQILVNLSGYHLGLRDNSTARETVKEAILLGQSKNALCLPQAYRLFSLVSLSKQQMNETSDYLGFALTNAEATGNYYETGLSSYYAASARFLYGDIYRAAKFVRKSVEQSLASGCPGWADKARFLEGRLEFELGHYREACEIFEALRYGPFDGMTDEKDRLLAAWIYRSGVYSGNSGAVKPAPSCLDTDVFEIEAAYLAGDYSGVTGLSCSLEIPFPENAFLYTEKPDWSSGFTQCEHLCFSQGEIHWRMVSAFHALALCRLPGKDTKDAVQSMQKILRDERLSEMDPWDTFYFYAWYRILEQTDGNMADMSTAVSMAFKRLQRRASRIGDIETRRQYLNGQRWNRELNTAAKDFRLI